MDMHTYTLISNTHTCTRIHTHIHNYAHKYTHMYAHKHTNTRVCTQTHTRMHINTHTHVCIQTYTHKLKYYQELIIFGEVESTLGTIHHEYPWYKYLQNNIQE